MLGNLNLGSTPLGTSEFLEEPELNYVSIVVEGLEPSFVIKKTYEVSCANISINKNDVFVNLNVDIRTDNYEELKLNSFEVDRIITNRIKPYPARLKIYGLPVQILTSSLTPTIEQYIDYLKTNIRNPIYKVEILRKSDETVMNILEGDIIDNSGSVSNTLDEGVRRTCSFNIPNYDNQYGDFVNNLSIGDKFKLYLGYKIDGVKKYFPQGVFVFDDPTMVSNLSERIIGISGTDKWSMLNGQNGGILEGTYTVPAKTKIGDLIRRTIKLPIVGDPIEPSIDKSIENMETTYDITKNAGETISDVLLEVALNISAYIYYDENGRLQIRPVDNDMFKPPSYVFSRDEYNYLGGTKKYQLSEIYNSVLVIGENVKNSNTPIVYEALNNDLTDPNSIPNVGFKKIKKITEYTKGIDTQEKAEDRGNWELKKVKAKISSVDINCLSLYHLDVNQIVVLTDLYLNSKDERFLINSIDLPIGTDVQSTISLVKAVDIE